MGGREHSQLEFSCSLCLDDSLSLGGDGWLFCALHHGYVVCMPSSQSRSHHVPSGLARKRSKIIQQRTYLLTGVSAAGDDGDSADLEELHFDVVCRRVNMKLWRGLVDLAL